MKAVLTYTVIEDKKPVEQTRLFDTEKADLIQMLYNIVLKPGIYKLHNKTNA